jgi:hypothetical protein
MSSHVRRTWHKHHVGQFLVTIEVDPVAEGHVAQRHRDLTAVMSRLLDIFEKHRVRATWAVSDPAFSAATSLVLRAGVEHELAILGDANWLGASAGRTRFARQLERRVSQARSRGIAIHSLVPRVEPVGRHIDLVVKQGIRAVAGVEISPSSRRSQITPTSLHYGVWELPVTLRLPQPSAWRFITGWRLRRQIRRAAREASLLHLVIDVPAVAQEGPRCEAMIARLIVHIAELGDPGLLQVETLGTAAARLSHVPPLSPQHSILRRAA